MKFLGRKTQSQRFLLSAFVLFSLILSRVDGVSAEESASEVKLETEKTPVAQDADAETKAGDFFHPEDARVVSPLPAVGMLAGGGALLLTGIITGSIALSLNSDLKDSCYDSYCLPAQHDDVDRLDALAAVTDAFIPLSAALLIAGTATFVASRRTARQYGKKTAAEGDAGASRLSFSGSSLTWRF